MDQFISFLEVLEVYGSGYEDDIDYKRYRLRESETHLQSTVK